MTMADLKLILIGDDPNATEVLPTLEAEQVNKLPSKFLGFLYDIGKARNVGGMEIIDVKDTCHHSVVKRSVEFYTTGHLQHGEITVERVGFAKAVLYRRDVHERDTSVFATPKTQELFLEQVHLYIFCLQNGVKDFQAYLCEAICTRYPIGEPEIVLLLTKLYQSPGIFEKTDSALLGHLCQRITLLRDALASSRPTLLLLRSKMDPKDRFLSLVPYLDEASVDRALQACRVTEDTEVKALLATFVEKHNSDASPFPTPRQTIDSTVQVQHTNDHTASSDRPASSDERSATPRPRKRSHSTAFAEPSNVITSADRARDVNQRRGDRTFRDMSDAHSGRKLRLTRPSAEDEYWSITKEKWNRLTDVDKRCFTHARAICETEAGMVAPEPCSNCAEANVVCKVYTPESHERNKWAGWSCARCRTKLYARCSFSEEKRSENKRQRQLSPLL